jgi:hypothetical protein
MTFKTETVSKNTKNVPSTNPLRTSLCAEGDEDDEDDEGEEDVEAEYRNRVRRRGPPPAPTRKWPWMASSWMRDALKYFGARSSQFRLPKFPVSSLGQLKIHDWICLCGSITAYMIMQCDGIDPDYKSLLIDFTYAIESITHKAYKRSDIPGMMATMAKCLADLEIMMPTYFSGTITRRQLYTFWVQVRYRCPRGRTYIYTYIFRIV